MNSSYIITNDLESVKFVLYKSVQERKREVVLWDVGISESCLEF